MCLGKSKQTGSVAVGLCVLVLTHEPGFTLESAGELLKLHMPQLHRLYQNLRNWFLRLPMWLQCVLRILEVERPLSVGEQWWAGWREELCKDKLMEGSGHNQRCRYLPSHVPECWVFLQNLILVGAGMMRLFPYWFGSLRAATWVNKRLWVVACTVYLQPSKSEHYGLRTACKNCLHGPQNLFVVLRGPRTIRRVGQTILLYNMYGHENTLEQFCGK